MGCTNIYRNHVLSIAESGAESIRTPAIAAWLGNVALRELGLHERHAACVDARGDVYQWGDGFEDKPGSSSGQPTRTLRGKVRFHLSHGRARPDSAQNIIRLQLTSTRVYALSASGHIYVLSSASAQQALRPGEPTLASSPWWGTGWLWGEEEDRDFAQIVPDAKLGRREKSGAFHAHIAYWVTDTPQIRRHRGGV